LEKESGGIVSKPPPDRIYYILKNFSVFSLYNATGISFGRFFRQAAK
jgi:hypothetical protein